MPQHVPEIHLDEDELVEAKDAEQTGEPDEESSSILGIVIRCTVTFLAAIAIFALVKVFVAGTYEIPSASMEDTIQIGDLVISEKVSYSFRDPEPGEVITFKDPIAENRTLIKRVIATEGQTVELSGGRVVVDGKVLEEPYADGDSEPLPNADGHDFEYPYTIPEGHVFVMGDNRTNSADSRYFGAIPVDSISGHGICIYWPVEHWSGL